MNRSAFVTATRIVTPLVGRWFERLGEGCAAKARQALPTVFQATERARTWIAGERELVGDLLERGRGLFEASRPARIDPQRQAAAAQNDGQRAA